MNQMTRREAMKAGSIFYHGKVCLRGHKSGRRYTKSARCIECALEDRAADMQMIYVGRAEIAARSAAA